MAGEAIYTMDNNQQPSVGMRPYSSALDRLRDVGLRPTRQRLALAKILFSGDGNRHVTAEELHSEARQNGVSVSLATIYNTLHQFTQAGLLNEVVVEAGRSYFDTNTEEHHHFFFERTNRLQDISAEVISVSKMPPPPEGSKVKSVDVIIRLDA
jgi:Fur family transcriptional regulator, iron response regulator